MCKLKSVLVLKDRVFCPDYDSHEDMLQELGIEDNMLNAQKTFVRVELSPKYGDFRIPVEEWKMEVDQDIVPEWFDAEGDYERVLEAVKAWAEKHIIKSGKTVVRSGIYYLSGSSEVVASGTAMVKAAENAKVDAFDNSTVEACGNSTVKACGNSTVEAWDNSTVKAWDNSIVVKTVFSLFSNKRLSVNDNATYIDHESKTIVNANYEFKKSV